MNEKNKDADEIYLATTETQGVSHEGTETDALFERGPSRKEKKSVIAKKELSKKRSAHGKVMEMSDRSETAVFYPRTRHVYHAKTKTFEEVDHSFREDEDGRYFSSGANRFTARFSKEVENDELFSVEKNGRKVTVFARKNKKGKNHGVIPSVG